jgi:nucleoside-diphosphate-sugar epimerase
VLFTMEGEESNLPRRVYISHPGSYLNTHLIVYLLEWGVECVLGMDEEENESSVSHVKDIYAKKGARPQIVRVDVFSEKSIREAIRGCDAIVHPLSLDPWYLSEEPTECYKKQIHHAVMMLYCANLEEITRVVFTGSLVSVYGGRKENSIEARDEDWGDINNMTPQARAYLYAERAIWAFNKDKLPKPINITVLNVGNLFGPSLAELERCSSFKFIYKVLNTKTKDILPIKFPFIDVRDAALAHLLVLGEEATFGRRFNVCQGTYWMEEVMEVVRDQFKDYINLTISTVGKFPLKLASMFDDHLKQAFFHCGKDLRVSNFRIRQIISIKMRSLDESLIDMIYYMIHRGQMGSETSVFKHHSHHKDKDPFAEQA